MSTIRTRQLLAAMLVLGACQQEHEAESPKRRFVDLAAPMLLVPGRDTILSSFVQSALLEGDQIILLQPQDARVISLDVATGRPRWSTGRRGAGPGEFVHPQSLFARVGGGVGVVDSRQGRITLLTSTGEVAAEVGGEIMGKEVQNVCDAGAAGLLALQLPNFGLLHANTRGKLRRRDLLVWPDSVMNRDPYMKQAYWASSRDGQCVLFAMMGNFFAEYDAESLKPRKFHEYLVPFVYPKPVGERNGFPTYDAKGSSAGSGVIFNGDLYVLYGGQREPYYRIIDVYLISSGVYRHSILLPRKTYAIDILDDRLLVVEISEEGQAVAVYPLPIPHRGSD